MGHDSCLDIGVSKREKLKITPRFLGWAKSRGSMSKGDVLRKHKVYLGNGMLSSSAGGQECMGNEEK